MSIPAEAPACPRCKGPTKLRTSQRGPFFSCVSYPMCHGTIDAPGAQGAPAVTFQRPPMMGVPGNAQPIYNVPQPSFTLDAYQQAACDHRQGWAVVAAAAGSGKSTVLVERAALLIAEGVIPEAICILAFNTSAAELIRTRIAERVGHQGKRVSAYTFHAFAFALLKNWFPRDPRFLPGHILGGNDGPHPIKIVAPLIQELKLEIDWGSALKVADRVSESLIPLDAADAELQLSKAMGWGSELSAAAIEKAAPYLTFCRAWKERKRRDGLIDFTDMLCDVALAIAYQQHAPHVQALAGMYEHVMVDELQDGNLPRMMIARWLGQKAKSLVGVGDLRQSIANFAGAKPELFMELAHTPGVTLLTLPVNRRSSQRIVEVANLIARGRDWNLGGDCFPRPDAPVGEPVQLWEHDNPQQEASQIISDIQRRVTLGTPMEYGGAPTFCCVARTNAMLVDLECAFVARGVPVKVGGSPGGLWGSQVGQELLWYLEGVEGIPSFGLIKVANKPLRYAKKADLGTLLEQAQEREKTSQQVQLHAYLQGAKTQGIQRLGNDLARLAKQPWGVRCLQVARWLGLDDASEDLDGGDDRKAALEALMHLAQQLGSLQAIYEYKQKMAKGEKEPAVLLSTIHGAKGREWPVVYVCGVRVDKLPHSRAEDIEEERRLFYVAVTRARDICIVSTGGTPSVFLVDLGWVKDLRSL